MENTIEFIENNLGKDWCKDQRRFSPSGCTNETHNHIEDDIIGMGSLHNQKCAVALIMWRQQHPDSQTPDREQWEDAKSKVKIIGGEIVL